MMNRSTILTATRGGLHIGLALLLSGCAGESTTPAPSTPTLPPRGERLLAIDVLEGSDGDYDRAFDIAQGLGMQVVGLFLQWDVLEPEPGRYDDTLLTIANAYYPATGVALDLTMAPINTTTTVLPADLVDRPLDDPVVIERFARLLDFALDHVPDVTLHSLNIGSEMDILFGTDEAEWRRFEGFYAAAAAHVAARRPQLTVTVEPTFEGLVHTAPEAMRRLNAHSGAIAISYYPSDATSDMADPVRVSVDFDTVAQLYPGRPIHFLQFGYASSPVVGGSEERQAEFIRQTFAAWDRHAQQVRLIDFTWLHDLTAQGVAETVDFYCLGNPGCEGDARLAAFLGSLGLLTSDGRAKPAFAVLQEEAAARGW